MASVATANTNNSNNNRSEMEKDHNLDNEDNKLANEGADFNTTINLYLQNAIQKNKYFTKGASILRAQYNRAVKQKDDNIQKHTQALKNRRTMYKGLKTCHKTEVSDLKSSWKHKEKDLKETHRADIVSKSELKFVCTNFP
jgi:hypothetical protein